MHVKARLFLLFFMIVFTIFSAAGCIEEDNRYSAGLTQEELAMPEARYYDPDFAALPQEVTDALAQGPMDEADALSFRDAYKLQEPGYHNVENGYALLDNDVGYVAVKTDFPGATGNMIYWWFWWHGYKDIRYKIWCPGYHYATIIKDLARMNNPSLSYRERVENNTIYSVEDVGMGVQKLAIKFVPPETFGFNPSRFKMNGIEAVLCVEVGLMIGNLNVEHSYMCHVWRKKGDGLELRSRFWLGKKLQSRLLRQLIITEDTVRDMVFHCSLEYNHLAGFLPEIYNEFRNQP